MAFTADVSIKTFLIFFLSIILNSIVSLCVGLTEIVLKIVVYLDDIEILKINSDAVQ